MVRLHFLGLLLGSIWIFAASFAIAEDARTLELDASISQRVALGQLAEVHRTATNERWLNQSDSISLGFGAGLHEADFRFDVTKSGLDSNWLLDLGSGSVRHIRLLHWIDDVLVADIRTGTGYPAETRPLDYYQFIFPLSMREGQHLLRLEVNSHNSVSIIPSLNPPLAWFATAGTNQWLVGGMMGTFLMLAFYNLVIYSSTRERVFLLFALSCFAGALWRASDLGLTAQYLNSFSPDFYEPLSRFSAGMYVGFLLLFCCEFLQVDEYAPKLAKWSWCSALLIMVLMVFPIFRHAPAIALVMMLLCPLLAVAVVIRAKLQRVPGSGLFLVGVGIVAAGGFATGARMQGWIGPMFEVRAIADTSIIFVTILTSIALASRLSEEKLRRELAVAATKAKSLFLANMSHELRTPLNAIVGFSDLLHDSDLGDEHKGFARRIDSASKNLLVTINDLLDYSKLEAGQLIVEREPVEIEALLANVHSLFERRAEESKLLLRYEIAAEVPRFFLGDSLRLIQILSNLVSNALKFTNQGEVLVRAVLARRASTDAPLPQGQQWVWFEVRDTGIGLTQAQQASLFVPFAQADTSTTRRFGGTGLGLAICKELVESMGGLMTLRSRPDKGSCFRFSLCLEACVAPLIQQPLSTGPGADLSSFKVLVVEDNKTNQLLIKAMLKKSEAQFILAENGEHALQILKQLRVDMVFMDCQMPVMDGYLATQAIRHDLGLRNLPIVALTANASPEDRTHCLNVGMNDFLTKPVRYLELHDALHKWLPAFEAQNPDRLTPEKPPGLLTVE